MDMTDFRIGARVTIECSGDRAAMVRRIADWLSLAAAPAFAVMMFVNILGDGGAGALCMGAPRAWPFDGMAQMYLLMSIFHLAPWLRLVGGREG
jgi:hypothetical protein